MFGNLDFGHQGKTVSHLTVSSIFTSKMLGNHIKVKKQDDLFITEPLKDRSICFFAFTVLSRVNVYVYANVG